MTKRFTIALMEYNGHLYAFKKISNTNEATEINWENLLIKGESSWPLRNEDSWQRALQEISDQLNSSSKLAEDWIYWIFEETQQNVIERLQRLHDEFAINHWSLLHWQGLKELGLIKEQDLKQDLHQWLADQLTHLLLTDPQESKQFEQQIALQDNSAETDLITQLAQEKQLLATENEQLMVQLEAQQKQLNDLKERLENTAALKMEMETLVSYLPAIYKNFWGQIRPDEVALLAGSLQIPEVPSPVREPDVGVLQVFKKRLQTLPQEQKEQLRHFCQQLPHSPQPRSEMAFFFEGDY